jgi:hypothetical protein
LRLEEALGRLETRAKEAIEAAKQFKQDEGNVLQACRRDLTKADRAVASARERYNAADATVASLMSEPVPLVFGRKDHQKRQRAADTAMEVAKKRLETAITERDGAAKRVTYWVDVHQTQQRTAAAPLLAAAAVARKTIFTVRKTRSIAKERPTLLRFGPLAVYQYAVGRVEMEARPQETWTGAVDIWGIPIEPPRGWRP